MKWTEKVSWFLEDRPSIWLPALWAVGSVVIMGGTFGTLFYWHHVRSGGEQNYLGILFLVFTAILALFYIAGIIATVKGDFSFVSYGVLAVCFGFMGGVVCPFISWYGLRLLVPHLLAKPIFQAIAFNFNSAPYRLFGNVGITGLYLAMVVGPLLAISLVSLLIHLLMQYRQSRRAARCSLQPAGV